MQVGGQRLLGIPPDQGYGSRGNPPDIAPDETLWFVVEIVETKAGVSPRQSSSRRAGTTVTGTARWRRTSRRR